MTSLDDEFGALEPPGGAGVRYPEMHYTPETLHVLDAIGARTLAAHMAARHESAGFCRWLHERTTILWVVDAIGDVRFAIEEVVDGNDGRFFCSYSDQKLPPTLFKLGHPALVQAAAARIGGEIIFDAGSGEGRWYITNKSGRYGLVGGRQRYHLRNVRRKFGAFGIRLYAAYITPLA